MRRARHTNEWRWVGRTRGWRGSRDQHRRCRSEARRALDVASSVRHLEVRPPLRASFPNPPTIFHKPVLLLLSALRSVGGFPRTVLAGPLPTTSPRPPLALAPATAGSGHLQRSLLPFPRQRNTFQPLPSVLAPLLSVADRSAWIRELRLADYESWLSPSRIDVNWSRDFYRAQVDFMLDCEPEVVL